MEIPAHAISSEAQALIDRLQARGYLAIEERYDERRFGDAVVTLKRDSTLIRLVRDRGQWFVEVCGPGGEDWFAPIIWSAFLDSSMPSLETASFDAQARALLDDLGRIE